MAIKIENVVTPSAEQWEAIIRGTRNPMNSWNKSDSFICKGGYDFDDCKGHHKECIRHEDFSEDVFCIGENDLDLMTKLSKAGTDHRKFMRMIVVYADVTAPLYWWKEYDTYKIGTVANSCSTMHKIHSKQFELADFSHEHLTIASSIALQEVIHNLNYWREQYDMDNTDKVRKDCWWQMIQLLPQSYNQKRTIMLNYEVLANIYRQRKCHKLDEWRDFCKWIEQLPYSELITDKEA